MSSIADGSWKEAMVSFAGLSVYRTFIGTPLDGVAKREILAEKPLSTWKVVHSLSFKELWKGFQPNTLKFITKTYTQLATFKIASWIVPTPLDAAFRGALIGVLSSGMELTVQNAWNALVTRFIQGQGWSVLRTEGFSLLSKGLSPALVHRSLSGALFWGAYEKLRQLDPHHPAITGVAAGVIQVSLTSPFYITTVLRQGKNPPAGSLLSLMQTLVKREGWVRGLFLRGLLPRYLHSMATSAPLMFFLERYGIIHR